MNGELLAQVMTGARGLPGAVSVSSGVPTSVSPSVFQAFSSFVHFIHVLFSFASIFFMLVIIFVVIQQNVLYGYERSLFQPYPRGEDDENEDVHDTSERPRFDNVKEHLDSDNEAQWRVAIIEADNILYDVLRAAQFQGDSLGEMLTYANEASFRTLENAWEAHKVRNKIAHEGESFRLSKREAKRVIALYESVFREFSFL